MGYSRTSRRGEGAVTVLSGSVPFPPPPLLRVSETSLLGRAEPLAPTPPSLPSHLAWMISLSAVSSPLYQFEHVQALTIPI